MRFLGEKEIKQIALGATLIGAGGGGDPYIGELMALTAVHRYGKVKLISVNEIKDKDYFMPVADMGAPSIMTEKFPKGDEFKRAFQTISTYLNRKMAGTFPMEAGGVNSMMPIVLAAQMGLPIVDCDGMGRAFPELQMTTFYLGGVSVTPMVVTDEKGNLSLLKTVSSKWAERLARDLSVEMGGSAPIALFGSTGSQIKENGIYGIVSLCQKIGQLIQNIPKSRGDSLKNLLKITHGYHLFDGKVVDVYRTTQAGFNFGTIKFSGIGDFSGQTFTVNFQNENLIAKKNNQVVATVPDLISFANYQTLLPSTSEAIKYGKRLSILGIPANPKWRTKKGLQTIGPRYFKYDIDYIPIEKLVRKESL